MLGTSLGASAHHSNVVTSSAAALIAGQPHVYLLPALDASRLKIGRSLNPLDRIDGLTRIYPEIDLTRSVIVPVDSLRIEAVLHTVFGLRREARPKRSDGYTEWFNGNFLDEALKLLDIIACHRGTTYPVVRDVDCLVADYRATRPAAYQRTPRLSAEERNLRAIQARVRMQEAAIEHAQKVCDLVAESNFDALVHCGGFTYLSRTVNRYDTPECWAPKSGNNGSVWGLRFYQASLAKLQVDGANCVFSMFHPPIFSAIDDAHGREFFRVSQDRPNPDSLDTSDLFSPAAFAELWYQLDELPVIKLPGERPDQQKSCLKGLQ